uniref:hypothetical protein n=1 Tax=Vibrio alfacsensis TaxID=1074311 RepID=UPI0013E3E58E|nr:hypothetical protein [Vibrio alfacsensis]
MALVEKSGEAVQSTASLEVGQKHFAQIFGDFQPFTNVSKFVNEYVYKLKWNKTYFPYAFEKQLIEYGFDVTYTCSGLNGEVKQGDANKELFDAVLNADCLTKDAYDSMVCKGNLSIDEEASVLAYEICEGLQIDHSGLTLPIIKFWNAGEGRHTLKLYSSILSSEWMGSQYSERDIPHALRRHENVQLLAWDLLLSLSGLEVEQNRVTGSIDASDLCRLQNGMKLLAPILAQLKIISGKHHSFKASLTQIKNAFAKCGIFLEIKRVRVGEGKKIRKLVIDEQMMNIVYEAQSRLI